MSGLCSCLFDGRGELTDDVEQCFRAEPMKITSCNCVSCNTPLITEELEDDRLMAKVDQKTKKQTFVLVERLTIFVRRCITSLSQLVMSESVTKHSRDSQSCI